MQNSKTKTKQRRKDDSKRGLMTISPPAKVKSRALAGARVLASGVDSLNLALDVKWKDPLFLEILEIYRENAQNLGKSFPLTLRIPKLNEELLFNFAPYGTKGYKWLLSGNEYALRLYDSMEPKSRPNVMIEIRSETLWRRGILEAIDVILEALRGWGAKIINVKTSRIDLCMDVLLPAELWKESLFKKKVSRSRSVTKHEIAMYLTGVSIGKGKLSGRIYDKAYEIEKISHKTWMYKIWGIDKVPENKRAIRIEFQLLREPIKELGFDTIEETLQNLEAIWAYCTQDWLKFQTNQGKHHTQRKVLPWWSLVQNSFLGIPEPTPAIRSKAVHTTQIQLSSQIVGLITSLAATKDQFGDEPLLSKVSQEALVHVFRKALRIVGKSNEDLCNSINDKRARNHRGKQKYRSANWKRLNRGLPTDMFALAQILDDPYQLNFDDES